MVKENELNIVITIGMLMLVALGMSIVNLTRKNRSIKLLGAALLKEELEKKELEKVGIAITTQEKERSEIARKLHDEVGGILSMAQLNLSLAAVQENTNGDGDQNYLTKAADLLDIGHEQLRTITKSLVPHYLVKFGLSKALEKTISQKMGQLTTKYTFKTNLTEDTEIEENIMIHFFFISSELITNLMKHSRPDKVDITLNLEDGQLQLHLEHNGLALSQNDYEKFSLESDSLGLMNIRYRLHLINGQLHFTRKKDKGEVFLNTSLTLS
jgi:signal transduction histidine kinase